jgi:hypothetical protein
LSNGIGYSYWTEFAYQQTARAFIQGVEIHVWLNTTNHQSSRNWLCPLVISGESQGPYVVEVRLEDPDMRAKKYRINSAQIQKGDGTVLRLGLIGDDSQLPDGRWHPFFANASRWIGNVYHKGELALDGPVTIQLDVSVDKDGSQHQKIFTIRMVPTVDRNQGLVTI